ncbi:MAG TPA: zinc-dependent alcohol dehydrogenase family protein [Bellilinea sp.]|nr:zinc-dependent alcohol dehydrogenase family protein [Bellilinea sp.]
MQAMRLIKPAPVEDFPLISNDVNLPLPDSRQLLLRVLTCGVCHTDLHIAEGELTAPGLPLTLGHQVVAEIESVGEALTGFSVGQRVGVPWMHTTCGQCEFCRRGEENLCELARFTGLHVDGGFAEFMLADPQFVLPLPATMSDLQAAPLLCAGIIGYRALRQADLHPGERLGLFGFGASAHLAIQLARHWDCEVYVFTRSAQHRRHAESLGAAWTGSAEDSPSKLLDRAVSFAPIGELVPLALEKLRRGGTLAINSVHSTPIPQLPYALIYGERTLRSVTNATRQDGLEFLDLAAEIPLIASVTEYPLEDSNEALLDVKNASVNGQAVLRVAQSLSKLY